MLLIFQYNINEIQIQISIPFKIQQIQFKSNAKRFDLYGLYKHFYATKKSIEKQIRTMI